MLERVARGDSDISTGDLCVLALAMTLFEHAIVTCLRAGSLYPLVDVFFTFALTFFLVSLRIRGLPRWALATKKE